jgi:DNA-binding MarR family transcriptional regulator
MVTMPVPPQSPDAAALEATATPAPSVIDSLNVAHLLEQASRNLHALGHIAGLVPAQWAALRFFRSMRSPNNTAMALARYQGMAFGPVSRTVRTLIAKGLLRKAGSAGPGRAEAVELTPKGTQVLADDPLAIVAGALTKLSESERSVLAKALELVTLGIAKQSHRSKPAD